MNRKNVGIAFGALCGLAALTATAAEIFYDISINTKSPIHMSKLNNLVQKATNTAGNEEEASAKYSGMTGTPEIKEWYATHGEDVYILSDSLRLHGKRFKNTGTKYVLVCHGYTSKAKHMAGFVHKFYTLGYKCFGSRCKSPRRQRGNKNRYGLAGAYGYYKVDKPDPFMGAERPDRSARCIHGGGNGFDGVR